MQYGTLKSTFSNILRRNDCTVGDRETFIKLAIDAINRKLRADFMETTGDLTISSESDAVIPDDIAALISIYDPAIGNTEQGAYVYRPWHDFNALSSSNTRRYYTRRSGKWYFKPTLAAAHPLKVFYFQKTAYPSTDTDEPGLFKSAPDLVIYQALEYAADSFQDDRLPRFETKAAQLMQDAIDDYSSRLMSEGPMAIEPSTDSEY